jgi:hypothetical protein
MARPTKLTAAMVKKAHDYDYIKLRQAIPTMEGLALFLGVNRSSVYEWQKGDTKLHEEFSHIADGLLAQQANELINKGLKGVFNAKITTLILSGKHGYVEKTEVDNNLKGAVQFVNDVPRPKGTE